MSRGGRCNLDDIEEPQDSIKNRAVGKASLTVVVNSAVPPVCVKTAVEVAVLHGSEISVTEI